MVLLLLLTTWLGAHKLNADGLWFDEWWSLYVAGADVFHVARTPVAIWERITNEDIRQGILYPYLLASWGSTAGWSLFATRALSLFAGLIALTAVYRVGHSWSKRPLVGFVAAALLGSSVWFVYFLHEMRVYMLLLMLTTLVLLAYDRIMYWRREPNFTHLVALALATGFLLNTHYFAGPVIALLGIWHILHLRNGRPGRRWWTIIGAWIVAAIMLTPWVINLPTAMEIARNEPRVQPDLNLLIQIAQDTFYAFSNASVALLVLLLLFSLLSRSARRVWLLLIGLLSINLAAYYAFSLNELRYNMTVLPFLALLVGFGSGELADRRIPPLLIAGLWFVSGLIAEPNFDMQRTIQRWPGQPIREMATELAPRVAPDDVIINLIGDENRPSLALHPLVHYLGDTKARIEVVENIIFPGTQNFARRVREAVGDAQHVWLLYDPRWASNEWSLFEYVLNEQSLYNCNTLTDTDSMLIQNFGRVIGESKWQFTDDISVTTIGEPRFNEGILQIWFGYQVNENMPSNTYSTAIHVLDRNGQLQAQLDAGLPATGPSCQYHELLLRDLPEGEYDVHLVVYNWRSGERLISSGPNGQSSDYPLLTTITIAPS